MLRRARTLLTAAAVLFAVGFVAGGAPGAWAQDPVEGYRNQCRAQCGQNWVERIGCGQSASRSRCQSNVNATYQQCAAACAKVTPPPPESTLERPWVDARTQWFPLPAHQPVGPLPQLFAIPVHAWDYASMSQPLRLQLFSAPAVVRVDIEVLTGRVGLSVATPGGEKLLTKEQVVTPQMGRTRIYLPLKPEMRPAGLLLRNFDAEGRPGSARVHAVDYALQSSLPASELSGYPKN